MRVGFWGEWMVLRRGSGPGRSLGFYLGERRGGWMMRILVLEKICHRGYPCFCCCWFGCVVVVGEQIGVVRKREE